MRLLCAVILVLHGTCVLTVAEPTSGHVSTTQTENNKHTNELAAMGAVPGLPAKHWTTVECVNIKEDSTHTCMFRNLLFTRTGWVAILPLNNTLYHLPPLRLTGKFGGRYRPQEKHFRSETERDEYLDGICHHYYSSVATYSIFPFHIHIGHFMYDGLNAMYQASLRFMPASMHMLMVVDTLGGFTRIPEAEQTSETLPDDDQPIKKTRLKSKRPAGRMPERCASIVQRFAGPHGFVYRDRLAELHATQAAMFAMVIIGVEGIGLHQYGRDVQYKEGVPGGMRMFRDRMYRMHGLPVPAPVERCEHGLVRQGNGTCGVPRGIIVANKRFRNYDVATFADSIPDISSRLTLRYIDWPDVSPNGFSDQLKLLAQTHVYVTGPGTGMLNHPFMPDGAVLINVGERFTKMRATCGKTHPHFMEVDIAAATWYYQSALYYNSSILLDGLRIPELHRLYRLAAAAVGTVHHDPTSLTHAQRSLAGRANLPPEGKLWVDLCMQPSDPCAAIISAIGMRLSYSDDVGNTRHSCGDPGWITSVVYEMCAYSETGRVLANNATMLCRAVPREQLRDMKRKLGPAVLATIAP